MTILSPTLLIYGGVCVCIILTMAIFLNALASFQQA